MQSRTYAPVRELLGQAMALLVAQGRITMACAEVAVDQTKDGLALCTNLAFALNRYSPKPMARALAAALRQVDGGRLLAAVWIAGPGFVLMSLSEDGYHAVQEV